VLNTFVSAPISCLSWKPVCLVSFRRSSGCSAAALHTSPYVHWRSSAPCQALSKELPKFLSGFGGAHRHPGLILGS